MSPEAMEKLIQFKEEVNEAMTKKVIIYIYFFFFIDGIFYLIFFLNFFYIFSLGLMLRFVFS